jgi:hypothetical protein
MPTNAGFPLPGAATGGLPRTPTNAGFAVPGSSTPSLPRTPTSAGFAVPGSSTPSLPRTPTSAGFAVPVASGAQLPRLSTGGGFAAPALTNPGVPTVGAAPGGEPAPATGAAAAWAPESPEGYLQRRAADLRLDLSNEDNLRSLEIEYLSRNVPRGVVAKAWAAVAPLADRWAQLAPQDPQAVACQARARIGVSPFLLPSVLAGIEKAAQANRKSVELQLLHAELLWETGDRKAFESALRAYAALVPASDRQLAELVNRKRVARGDVEQSPVVAGGVALGVLVCTLIAAMALGRVEYYSDPLSPIWLVRHAILLVGALLVVGITSTSLVNALRTLGSPGPTLLLPLAVAGGLAVQVGFFLAYGAGRAPPGFSLPLALVALLFDVVLQRLLFQFALQPHFEVAGDRRVGVLAVVFVNWLYAGTYAELWVGPTTYFTFTGVAAACSALPCALLFARGRSIVPAVLWQFSLYALQVVLFR